MSKAVAAHAATGGGAPPELDPTPADPDFEDVAPPDDDPTLRRQVWAIVDRTVSIPVAAVLRLRFRHDMTLDEISKAVDLPRERLRQLEKRALAKLRRRIKTW